MDSGLGFQSWRVRPKSSQNHNPQNTGPIFPAIRQQHPCFGPCGHISCATWQPIGDSGSLCPADIVIMGKDNTPHTPNTRRLWCCIAMSVRKNEKGRFSQGRQGSLPGGGDSRDREDLQLLPTQHCMLHTQRPRPHQALPGSLNSSNAFSHCPACFVPRAFVIAHHFTWNPFPVSAPDELLLC